MKKHCLLFPAVMCAVLLMSACQSRSQTPEIQEAQEIPETQEIQETYEFYNSFIDDHESFENTIQSYPETSPDVVPEGYEDITDQMVNEHFQSAYGWAHLKSHHVFWDEANSQVVMNLVFSSDSPLWEIDSARKYAESTFIKKVFHNMSPHTYQYWAQKAEISTILTHIFAEDEILLQDYYEGTRDSYSVSSYENTGVTLQEQFYQFEQQEALETALKQLLPPDAEIHFKKSLVLNIPLIQIESDIQVNPENLENINDLLSELPETLEDSSGTALLELYNRDGDMYYQFLLNGDANTPEALPVPAYPLEEASLKDAVKESGLNWDLKKCEILKEDQTVYTFSDTSGKDIAYISCSGEGDSRFLQLSFFSSGEISAPLPEDDWDNILNLASSLYGGFRDTEQLAADFQNTYEETALTDQPEFIPADEERVQWRREIQGIDCFVGLKRKGSSSDSAVTEMVTVQLSGDGNF